MKLPRRTLLVGLMSAPLLGGADLVKPAAGPAAAPRTVLPVAEPIAVGVAPPEPPVMTVPPTVAAVTPRWQRFAANAPNPGGKPIICIVIDDLGVMGAGTARAVALPGPLTLAWFPFARNLAEQVARGTERGHETVLHMPMQALGHSDNSVGPDPLRIDISAEENLRRLVAALDAVPDTVGLNNHMGSVATRDVPLMNIVAAETRKRDMLFLDSLTIGHSVACQQALEAGVPACSRDVFIDDVASSVLIQRQLELTEHISRRQGHVISIGHPRPLTLNALEAWVPSLAAKGFVLWPLSATTALRHGIAMPATRPI